MKAFPNTLPTPSRSDSPRQLVLLGAGHAHVQVLGALAQRALAGVQVTLVSPQPALIHYARLGPLVAGHDTLARCSVALEPLLRASGANWVQRSVTGLDANTRRVHLDDGSTLPYHWLSVNTGAVQNRELLEQHIPGVREHGLFVRPFEAFAALWPQVVELGQARALRVAVIGAGEAGLELAMAVRQRMPAAALSLITGGTQVAAGRPAALQLRITQALRQRHITVLQERAAGLNAQEVQLASGARLACDVALIATGANPPPWLADSCLALDAAGFMTVDICLRSTSHANVFGAGDACTCTDLSLGRNGVAALAAGAALAANLRAVASGQAATPHRPAAPGLKLLCCSDGQAIASWRGWSVQGTWVSWLRQWRDQRTLRHLRQNSPS